jgi:hypothetical protein
MDMNDVIVSLGGVERITAPLGIDATDEQIADHLANHVVGSVVPTLEQVKAQVVVYQAQVAKAQFEQVQAQSNADALAYLASTDWYVVRFSETGVVIPDEIKTARQLARDAIV